MEGRARTVLAAVVVALVLIVPLVALFAGGDDEDAASEPAPSGGLRLERSATLPELLVYVRPRVNTPERAGGARRVTLRCVDAAGRLVAAQDEAWPFADTDGGTISPHAHIPLDAERMRLVRDCSLVGADPPLEGSLP